VQQSQKNTPKRTGLWHEGRIVLFTAVVTTLFTFVLNSWQSSEQRTRDAAVEQNRLYLEVKRAASAHWVALTDFIQLHADHDIKLMFDEATMPKALSTNCIATASMTIVTNCTPPSPNDKGQLVTDCTITSLVRSNIECRVSTKWPALTYHEAADRDLQRSEAATRTANELLDALHSGKPFFSETIRKEIDGILNEPNKFPEIPQFELYRKDLEAAIATGDGDAVHSVTSRIAEDVALALKNHPYRNHVNALLDHMQGELRLAH
jgi:hypothetical protein